MKHLSISSRLAKGLAVAGAGLLALPVLAQAPAPEAAAAVAAAADAGSDVLNHVFELQYAMDTFYFLVCGALVMWMAAGFSMLEAGLVRAKNTD
jgi:ammonium transporter, Amt family